MGPQEPTPAPQEPSSCSQKGVSRGAILSRVRKVRSGLLGKTSALADPWTSHCPPLLPRREEDLGLAASRGS